MIAWTIDAALRAPSVSRVVVSTESDEIAALARRLGADVPWLRPAALAEDDTDGTAPILYTVQRLLEEESYTPRYVIVLQPTSPLRTADDIEQAVTVARHRQAGSVVSVCEARQPVSWMRRLGPEGQVWPLEDAVSAPGPARDAGPVFVLNGAVYLVEREVLLARRSLYAETPYAFVMPVERSIDVDTVWDLHLADLALRFPFGARA